MTSPTRQRIVAALDLDDTAEATWRTASALLENPHAEVSVVHVVRATKRDVRTDPSESAATVQRAHDQVQQLLTRTLSDGTPASERVDIYVVLGEPAAQIVQLAVDLEADVIVVGTNDRSGVERLMLGSVSSELFRNAPCSVLVARTPDYSGHEKSPTVDPPLAPGQSPMHGHAVVRYRSSPFATYNANLFPTGIPRKQVR